MSVAIEKTEAIALRIAPFSETSHIVSWLTPSHGRIATIVKGAQRPKSAFLGQYDLFYTCELLFYARERGGLHIARACAPIETRSGFRSAWRACAAASYLCDLAHRVQLGGTARELFALMETVLDWLPGAEPRPAVLFWFELQLLRIEGVLGRFDCCARCGEHQRDGRGAFLAASLDRMVCLSCAPREPRPSAATAVPADILAMLRAWSASGDPRDVRSVVLSRDQILAFCRLSDMLAETLLGVKTVNRSFALDAMLPG